MQAALNKNTTRTWTGTVETSGGRGDSVSDGINEVKRSLCRYIPLGLLYLWGIKTTTNDSDTLAGWLSLPYCAV